MNPLDHVKDWFADGWRGWNDFWFAPRDSAMLGAIRILAGSMLFYTHFVWTLDFLAFFGPHAWISRDLAARLQGDPFAWSHLWMVQSPPWLWITHFFALLVFLLFTIGLFTKVTSVLAWLFAVSYAHRAIGTQFGLDQINIVLAMYLMLGPSGAAYSVDRWLASKRSAGPQAPAAPSIRANIATRLLQIHMCVIYLFAGLAKLQGPSWWNGTAMWGAIANLQYQSLDMTWLVHYPIAVAVLTHVTVFWEISYCALVWPKWIRPVIILLAVPLHLGIAVCLGMATFGMAMMYGNLAFVPPKVARALFDRKLQPRLDEASLGGKTSSSPRNTRRRHRLNSRVG